EREREVRAATFYYFFLIPSGCFLFGGLTKLIENEFVGLRKAHATRVNENTLHLRIDLSRLVANSYGESELTSGRWEKTFGLFERAAALPAKSIDRAADKMNATLSK